MADNKYTQAIEKAKSDLEAIHQKMEAINTSVSKINTSILKQLSKGLGNTPQNAQNGINNVTKATEQLNNELKEQKKITRELERYKKNLNVAYQRGRIERQHAVRQAKLEAQATSSLVGAYQNLVAQQKLAKQALQNELAKRNQNNKAIKQAEARYNALTKRVQQATVATKQLSTVSMAGLVRGVSSLMAAFGVVGGVFLFAQVVTSIFSLTKKLQSLDYALKTVMPDARDFGRTQEFLKDIADRYGASIVALTERYTKFYAAAKQSNFALKDTEQIFESVTKAAGVLGLKQDELNGVFLALEQMISKGKVTTEELRRQLGERLPGAFGIMADAMGVTISDLDKMLRKGEIMSSEALPKFAKALEEAYGIENVTKVDTLVAAQTRLTNAWVDFNRALTGDGGGKAIMESIDFIANAMKNVTSRFESFFEVFEPGYTMWERAQIKLNSLTRTSIPLIGTYNGLFEENTDELKKNRKERSQLLDAIRMEGLAVKALYKEYIGLYGSIAPLLNIKKDENGFFSIFNAPPDTTTYYSDIEKQIKDLEDQLKSLSETEAKVQAPALREQIDLLKERLKIWDGSNSKVEDSKKIIEGTVAAIEEQISVLKKERDEVATTKEEYNRLNEEIEDLEKTLKRFQEGTEGLEILIGGSYDNGSLDRSDLLDEAAQTMQMEVDLENQKIELIKALREGGLEHYKHLNDEQIAAVEKAVEVQKELQRDLYESITDIGTNFLDARVEQVDEEIDLNREKYAEILNNEELSEEQRSAIEAERDAREAKLEEKKRKREKQAFMFKQALALAEIGMNLAKSISAINLAAMGIVATNPTIFGQAQAAAFQASNIPMSIAIAGAQTAAILAETIPKFEKGTENAPEGLAIIDEKRPEVHMDKHGNIKSFGSEGGARLTYTEKGDKIVPSHDKFFDMMGYDDMQKAIFQMNMQSNGEQLSRYQVDNSLLSSVNELKSSNEKVWKEVKKLASRPIHNNVNVTVKEDSAY